MTRRRRVRRGIAQPSRSAIEQLCESVANTGVKTIDRAAEEQQWRAVWSEP